ncbi:MAG TPA: EF-hand domain-containing protein [Candidatus Acidoferrales bacterium]|jgi:hypothetical protein|nr:EF-hand domain-containing protein [Candidatus Acidoferrales bacterium]
MWKTIIGVAACLLFCTLSLAAQEEQVFRGDICVGPEGRTPIMEDGEAKLPCTIAHPKRGAKYILFNSENKTTYQLDSRGKAKPFAGDSVFVSGILDKTTATIHITNVTRALSPKLTTARSVYIDCNACPRAMANAWSAAFQALTEWGRFDITPDPKKADLIFLFAANPYDGDYLTRDGPDLRPVFIKTTYMDVIDASTGKSLWNDSRQWGSFFVADATRDLFFEFKEQLALGETQEHRLLFLVDKDGDGTISKDEFLKFMDAEFDRLDTDKDGKLDADELKQLRVINIGKPEDRTR